MKENTLCWAMLSTMTSIHGSEKSSLGLSLFISLYSTHICTLTSFLGTGTKFATHWGYDVTTKNPALNCFITLALIFSDISGHMRRTFCLIGEQPSFIGRRWTKISVSSPGMYLYDQAKISTYSCNIWINLFLTLLSRLAPILTSFLSVSEPKFTTSNGSSCG